MRLLRATMPLASLQDRQQFVSEDELTSLYGWLDEIPLSRPKRNIYRDFADVSISKYICTLSIHPWSRFVFPL